MELKTTGAILQKKNEIFFTNPLYQDQIIFSPKYEAASVV